MIKLRPPLLVFFAGCLSSLALPPVFFFPFWFFSICVLLNHILKAENFLSAFKIGFFWGFGHFLVGLYWVAYGPATYVEDFWWAVPMALFGVPCYLAFFVAFISCISWFFRHEQLFSLYFAVIWVFFEWVREWIFTGFPWNSANYILHFSEILMQTSAIWGGGGQSLFVMFLSISIYDFYYKSDERNFVLASLWFTGVAIYGVLQLKEETKLSDIYVRLVQPSTVQEGKWNYSSFITELDKLINLSNLPSEHKIDLVIWPESAVIVPTKHQFILDKISQVASDGRILITGGEIEENGKFYTSIYAVNGDGNIVSRSHKYHLVPFGEYMPMRALFPNLKKLTPGFVDWDPGDKNSKIEVKELKILPLICYEALFASEVRDRFIQNADFFIHITNDSYYGNSSGPYQHFEQSRARAVEHNVPLVRVGSNGISAIIDSKGRVVKKNDLNYKGILDYFVPKNDFTITTYSSYGNLILIGLVWFLHFVARLMRKK
jgi:apolipoprotein N-acyltransferase